jgi:hypothetical protein
MVSVLTVAEGCGATVDAAGAGVCGAAVAGKGVAAAGVAPPGVDVGDGADAEHAAAANKVAQATNLLTNAD